MLLLSLTIVLLAAAVNPAQGQGEQLFIIWAEDGMSV